MKRLFAVMLLLGAMISAAGTAHADSLYLVQRGDTLYRIAVRFGTTVNALAHTNGLRDPNRIFAGQTLVIPGPGTAGGAQYIVRHGDTLWRIGQRFNSTVASLMTANHLHSTLIYTGQILVIPGRLPAP